MSKILGRDLVCRILLSVGRPLRLAKILAAALLLFLCPALVWSQTALPDSQAGQPGEQQAQQSSGARPSEPASGDAQSELQALKATPLPLEPPPDWKNERSGYKQTPRMFWVVPNFAAVNANTKLPPLTTRGKFVLATRDSVDYSDFTWTAILAGQAMATRSVPELGTGIKGYGRYYWRTFADGVSGTFFTEAIVPTITHEDPRYYTLGHGGFFRRFGYALSRTVITKTDSGGTSFNWSEVAGNALEAGLSNAYYPPQERGLRQTARDWGEQMESAVLNNIAKEFWPDIRHEIRHVILRHD
jgi:hypothetical protein